MRAAGARDHRCFPEDDSDDDAAFPFAADPGSDGRFAEPARDRRVRSRRARLARLCGTGRAAIARRDRGDPGAHERTVQRELLLPYAAGARCRGRRALARGARGLLRGSRARSGRREGRPRTRAVRRCDVRGRRGVAAGRRELSLRAPGRSAARSRAAHGRAGRLVRDDRRGSALAGCARRRRDRRAGRGGRRPSRHVPDRRHPRAAGPVRVAAADRRRGARAGDRRRRDRRRARHRGRVRARRARCRSAPLTC